MTATNKTFQLVPIINTLHQCLWTCTIATVYYYTQTINLNRQEKYFQVLTTFSSSSPMPCSPVRRRLALVPAEKTALALCTEPHLEGLSGRQGHHHGQSASGATIGSQVDSELKHDKHTRCGTLLVLTLNNCWKEWTLLTGLKSPRLLPVLGL